MTDEQSKASEICVEPGKDVFGNQLLKVKKFTEEIVCPSCHRHISANRFAPHLGKIENSELYVTRVPYTAYDIPRPRKRYKKEQKIV